MAQLIKVIESQVSRRGDRQGYIGSFLPLLSFLESPLLPCLLADGYSWHTSSSSFTAYLRMEPAPTMSQHGNWLDVVLPITEGTISLYSGIEAA